eukprot:767408-Hanusia_phi.AAC.3
MTVENTNSSGDQANDSHPNGTEKSAGNHGKGKDHSVSNAPSANEKNGTDSTEKKQSPSKTPKDVKEEQSKIYDSDDDMPLTAGTGKANDKKAQEGKDSKDQKTKSSDKPKDQKDTKGSHEKDVKQDGDAKAAGKAKEAKSKPGKVEAEDSDDEKPISKLKAENAKSAKKESKPVAPASDSDDDKPIRMVVAAKSPVKKETKASAKKRKKDSDSDQDDEPLRKSSKPKLSKNNSSSNAKRTGMSLKEWLIEKFLVRWWYVVEWPPKDRDLPKIDGYKELEHYPYLLFNEDTGHVKNCRTKETMPPCKEKYTSRPVEEVRKMVMEAIQKQMEALKEHEPNNRELLDILKKELKEVKGKTSSEF